MNCIFPSRDQYTAFIMDGVSLFKEYESGVGLFPAASSCTGFYDWMCGVSLRACAVCALVCAWHGRCSALRLAPLDSLTLTR